MPALLLVVCSSSCAAANFGATVSLYSDERFRGYSLSDGRPVGIVDLAYDDSSGVYAEFSASGVLRPQLDPAPLGFEIDGGYARRLNSGTTIDVGVTHSSYSTYSTGEHSRSYTQVYAGLARGPLSSRIFLSPDYLVSGLWTAYGELEGSFSLARKWSVQGHFGILLPLGSAPPGHSGGADYDWSLGVTRELGPVSLHAAWSDGLPAGDYYHDRPHSRSAFVLGATLML